MAHPVKLNWTVGSMKSAQEEVKKTSTLEAWPTLNNKTSMFIFDIQNLLAKCEKSVANSQIVLSYTYLFKIMYSFLDSNGIR